ncbi:MAG: lipoyl synthase [Deltaproteobacteria bacterium]|nr:lipoyl synthase [Deltaproteobacteria bacterium]
MTSQTTPAAAPAWLVEEVRRAKQGSNLDQIGYTSEMLARLELSTVCNSARCPNRGECFSHRTATFLILGEVCTRRCAFCAVCHGHPAGPPDHTEPERLACAVAELGLAHVVITSVTRDDLPDGGANHYAAVVKELRRRCPAVKVELLVPDFLGSEMALTTVLEAAPDILAHNLETVPRLYREVRPGARYERSLWLLQYAKRIAPWITTKSGLMLGLGEAAEEVEAVLRDLAAVHCDMLTLGQYLMPSLAHAPVARYVAKEEFKQWRASALGIGFKSVAAGSLVRSSYKAPLFYREVV